VSAPRASCSAIFARWYASHCAVRRGDRQELARNGRAPRARREGSQAGREMRELSRQELALAALDRGVADGLPIATGVIEGACRYLVQDRMGRTGARWSLTGDEAVLRLRALRASGDFDPNPPPTS